MYGTEVYKKRCFRVQLNHTLSYDIRLSHVRVCHPLSLGNNHASYFENIQMFSYNFGFYILGKMLYLSHIFMIYYVKMYT